MKITLKSILRSSLLLAITLTLSNCDNDDGNAPNQNVCTFQGLTVLVNGTQTLYPESDLSTEYLTAGFNGPEVEVFLSSDPGFFNFTTIVVNENDTGVSTINYDGTTYMNVATTCQRGVTDPLTGAVVGDEFRFDITANGLEMELCVIVDILKLAYVDADGDGCGSQTVLHGFGGVRNNDDTDDTDPLVCL